LARRQGHVYIVDNKTGGVYTLGEIDDNGLELADALLDSEDEARRVMRRLEQSGEYGKERLMSLDVYKDGKLVLEGTEFYTEQAGLDSFSPDGGQDFPEGYSHELTGLGPEADNLEW
jgi:hypothetical protein